MCVIDGQVQLIVHVANSNKHNLLIGLSKGSDLVFTLPTRKANYLTLNDLFKKKVLRRRQWDLLFPSGGAAPDSNKFDITLLFFLLTEICGLTPPPLGWHTKPSTSVSSFEALLAHVKFFWNEVYGHVYASGIDTLTFSTLWKDISAVLVSLGLDRVEIDK